MQKRSKRLLDDNEMKSFSSAKLRPAAVVASFAADDDDHHHDGDAVA